MEAAKRYPAKVHQERLKELKAKVQDSYEASLDNYKRFNEFMRFVFHTALNNDEKEKLKALGKPPIEFNVLEAMISRLRGEFAKQEPSLTVRAADGKSVAPDDQAFTKTSELIESYLREIFFNGTNDSLNYKIYTDLLGGGFSVARVFTDYINEMSFEQNIKVERVFDPTLTGFDPMARESHKGDGGYCFELIPKTKEEFEADFGADAAKGIKFLQTSSLTDFNWSYKGEKQAIVLVCDFYEKKKKRMKVALLSNGKVINSTDYEDMIIKNWEEQGFIEQPPQIIKERETIIETICRYRMCENKILDYVETDFKYLPLVFIDGNSVTVRDTDTSPTQQMTRPFVYHAKGIQKVINFSGQTVACEIENMVMHKWKAALEGIPAKYLSAYENPQQPQVLIYNAFMENDPNTPVPPPMEIQRTPTPPIVENTFNGSNSMMQAILGTYDGILANSAQEVSGVAIQQGAMHSNAAALPYLNGFIQGMNRIGQMVVDLISKYYRTPRSLPIRTPDGKRSHQMINNPKDDKSINLQFDPNDFQLNIEAGVNSTIQKQASLQMIMTLCGTCPVFADFINSRGLEVLLDNLDIRNIDTLKQQAAIYMKELQEAKAQAQENEKGGDLAEAAAIEAEAQMQIESAKIEQKMIQTQGDLAIQAAKVANEKQLTDIKMLQTIADIELSNKKLDLEEERTDSENARSAVELAVAVAEKASKQVEVFE